MHSQGLAALPMRRSTTSPAAAAALATCTTEGGDVKWKAKWIVIWNVRWNVKWNKKRNVKLNVSLNEIRTPGRLACSENRVCFLFLRSLQPPVLHAMALPRPLLSAALRLGAHPLQQQREHRLLRAHMQVCGGRNKQTQTQIERATQ